MPEYEWKPSKAVWIALVLSVMIAALWALMLTVLMAPMLLAGAL